MARDKREEVGAKVERRLFSSNEEDGDGGASGRPKREARERRKACPAKRCASGKTKNHGDASSGCQRTFTRVESTAATAVSASHGGCSGKAFGRTATAPSSLFRHYERCNSGVSSSHVTHSHKFYRLSSATAAAKGTNSSVCSSSSNRVLRPKDREAVIAEKGSGAGAVKGVGKKTKGVEGCARRTASAHARLEVSTSEKDRRRAQMLSLAAPPRVGIHNNSNSNTTATRKGVKSGAGVPRSCSSASKVAATTNNPGCTVGNGRRTPVRSSSAKLKNRESASKNNRPVSLSKPPPITNTATTTTTAAASTNANRGRRTASLVKRSTSKPVNGSTAATRGSSCSINGAGKPGERTRSASNTKATKKRSASSGKNSFTRFHSYSESAAVKADGEGGGALHTAGPSTETKNKTLAAARKRARPKIQLGGCDAVVVPRAVTPIDVDNDAAAAGTPSSPSPSNPNAADAPALTLKSLQRFQKLSEKAGSTGAYSDNSMARMIEYLYSQERDDDYNDYVSSSAGSGAKHGDDANGVDGSNKENATNVQTQKALEKLRRIREDINLKALEGRKSREREDNCPGQDHSL